jgi:hypothetical protein
MGPDGIFPSPPNRPASAPDVAFVGANGFCSPRLSSPGPWRQVNAWATAMSLKSHRGAAGHGSDQPRNSAHPLHARYGEEARSWQSRGQVSSLIPT